MGGVLDRPSTLIVLFLLVVVIAVLVIVLIIRAASGRSTPHSSAHAYGQVAPTVTSASRSIPPGWYPNGNIQRYWNGTTWTDDTAPLA
jgi:hypothetical protein